MDRRLEEGRLEGWKLADWKAGRLQGRVEEGLPASLQPSPAAEREGC